MQPNPVQRYAFKPFKGSSHMWALDWCCRLGAVSKALDVGPGSAMLGRQLKQRGVREVYALEVYEPAVAYLYTIYDRVENSLENFRGNHFDLILLLDVIEHMLEPFAFYEKVADLLAPGGTLLISVPNIAHWSVRLALLFGCFPYAQRGILDCTHYHFFNRRRFNQLLKTNPDLKLIEKTGSIEPIEFLLPAWVWDNPLYQILTSMRLKAANLLPGLLAYQHMAVLQRPPLAIIS